MAELSGTRGRDCAGSAADRRTPAAARPCPLCGATRGGVLARLTYALFDDLGLSGAKTLRQCASCGMLYDDVDLTPVQLQEYYRRNEHYAASVDGGGGGASPDNNDRYDRILDVLAPEKSGLILDYGCGQGGFLARCAERGYQAAGIEPCARSREACLASGRDVSCSLDAFAASHPGIPIRTLVMSHVLEHLLAPAAVLSDLVVAAQDARIYLEVPDASYLGPGPVRWDQLHFEHLCHFRAESLAALAVRCGIAVEGQGLTEFSPARADIPCRFIFGRCRRPKAFPTALPKWTAPALTPLPCVPGKALPEDRPLALWGVSQYAMLLIGSNRSLLGARGLFDISPAKLGRRIGGIAVQHPAGVATLPDNALLVVPSSAYAAHMLRSLREYGYYGESVVL